MNASFFEFKRKYGKKAFKKMKHWRESFDGSLSQQRQEFNGNCHRK
jgi:hypothetical protein